ncbi:hypothetical protein [Arenicella xantha]|uniref:hypothetical protein n=1 Tax=Arenicella xantha TaxID=644221 RepID=UPI0011BDDCEF|nr:hypothetical protein [Arenicella xantha]
MKTRFAYLSHVGVLITIFGCTAFLVNGNEFKNHSPAAPFSIFSFGVIVCIPYFHVMVVNGFFKKEKILIKTPNK